MIGYLRGHEEAILPARDYPLCPAQEKKIMFFFHIVKVVFELSRVKLQRKVPEGK